MKLSDYLKESYEKAKFEITNHFIERLRLRSNVTITKGVKKVHLPTTVKEIKKIYLPKIYKAIEKLNFNDDQDYALIYKDIIIVATVEKHTSKKHRIILKTALSRNSMKAKRHDKKIILEYKENMIILYI